MKLTNRQGKLTVAVAISLAIVAGGALVLMHPAQAQDDNPLKGFLDATGLPYETIPDETPGWVVHVDNKGDESRDVFLTYNDDKERQYALIFTTVVDKEKGFDFGKDVLVAAMKLNNDYSGAKFCLDADNGDIDCQTEVLMTTVNTEVLSTFLKRVNFLANEHAQELNDLVE